MCGVNGVTFKSICHAAVHNNYVDYPGMCDDVDPKYNIDFNKRLFHEYVNPRCKTVEVIGNYNVRSSVEIKLARTNVYLKFF